MAPMAAFPGVGWSLVVMSNRNASPIMNPVEIVPDVKQGVPVKFTVPVISKSPRASAVGLCVSVAVVLTTAPESKVNEPCQDPVTGGTKFAAMVPRSPVAQPVPVTEYVPDRAVGEDPVAVIVNVWPAMAPEVSVIFCPFTDPVIRTGAVGSKQAELMKPRLPVMVVPVWVRPPPTTKLLPGEVVEFAVMFQLPD